MLSGIDIQVDLCRHLSAHISRRDFEVRIKARRLEQQHTETKMLMRKYQDTSGMSSQRTSRTHAFVRAAKLGCGRKHHPTLPTCCLERLPPEARGDICLKGDVPHSPRHPEHTRNVGGCCVNKKTEGWGVMTFKKAFKKCSLTFCLRTCVTSLKHVSTFLQQLLLLPMIQLMMNVSPQLHSR